MEQQIRITENKLGEHVPSLFYKTSQRGQANYILKRLQEKDVRAMSIIGGVGIFSRQKLPLFLEIIKESFDYLEKDPPSIESDCIRIQKDKGLVCVLLHQGQVCYVTEDRMCDVQFCIFKREIPAPKHYFIFRTKQEMIGTIEEKENYII